MPALRTSILAAAACAAVAPAAAAQASLYDIRGQTGHELGRSVAALEDVDGDGFRDFAIGSPRAAGHMPDSGVVRVHSGKTGHTLYVVLGEATGDRFGHAVSATSDADGDGVQDLVVGAPHTDPTTGTDAGSVYLVSGATGQTIWKLSSTAPFDEGGWSVAGLGDVDGDGFGDYAQGVPRQDLGGADRGLVWVISGKTHMPIHLLIGETAGSLFGWSLDSAGDVNGDGVQDLIVGAPRWGNAAPDQGKAYVYSGASGLLLFEIPGTTGGSRAGWSVAGLGDLNGDGRSEVALGEPGYAQGGLVTGRVRVVSAAAPFPVLATLTGVDGSGFGTSIDGIGDTDGDGLGELMVGAPDEDPFGLLDRGAARVFSPLSGQVLYTSYGYQDGDRIGEVVGAAGDLNNDGFADWIACAPGSDGNAFVDSGWAHFVLSSAPSPVAYCTAKVNSAGCTPKLGYVGCPSASISDYFHLIAYDVLAFQPGVVFYGLGAAAIPFQGGTLCVAPPTVRLPVLQSGGNGADPCSGLYDQSFPHAALAAAGATPGTHLYFQAWSRDPGFAPPQNSGLTNGLDVLVLP